MGNLISCHSHKNHEPSEPSKTPIPRKKSASKYHDTDHVHPNKLFNYSPRFSQSRRHQDQGQATSLRAQEELLPRGLPQEKTVSFYHPQKNIHPHTKLRVPRLIPNDQKLLQFSNRRDKSQVVNFNVLEFKNINRLIQPEFSEKSLRKLQELINTARYSKTCTNLSLVIDTSTPSKVIHPLSKLKHLSALHSLDLRLYDDRNLTPLIVKLLSQSLSHLKGLTSLILRFSDSLAISPKDFATIFLPLKSLRSLSHLSICIDDLGGFKNLHLQKLAQIIRKLPQIKTLAFEFPRAYGLDPESLRYISAIFKSIPSLSEVRINIGTLADSSASAIQGLFADLKVLKSLTKLDLCWREEAWDSFFSGLETLNIAPLREISLKLDSAFKDSNLIQLSQSLQKFSFLKSLSLDFAHLSQVTDQGISQLAFYLKSLTKLSRLNLNFVGSSSSHSTFDRVSESLASLTQLTELSLNFSIFEINTTFSVQTLSSNLQKLKNLKSLTLLFPRCNNITNYSVTYITQALKELKDLTSLRLVLQNNETLTNKGIETIASSLEYLPKLTDLAMDFGGNQTDGMALKSLAQSLKNLHSLYSFDLVFHNTGNPQDQSANILVETLKSLSALREIRLKLKNCKVSPAHIVSLKHCKNVTLIEMLSWGSEEIFDFYIISSEKRDKKIVQKEEF